MSAQRTIRLTVAEAATGVVKTIRVARGRRVKVRIPPVRDGHVLHLRTDHGPIDIHVSVLSPAASKARERLVRVGGWVVVVGFAAIGPVLLLIGAGGMYSTAAPICNGQAMRPGDVCNIIASDGSGGAFDYQQMIARHQSGMHRMFIEGIVFTLIDVLIIALMIWARQRRRPAASAAGIG